jgi:predicted PurR-regulated permease PerM
MEIIWRADLVVNAFSKKLCTSYMKIVCILLMFKLYCIGVGLSVGTDLVEELSWILTSTKV